jgi:dTDP-4-dehydrorhamnose reductase
MYLIVGGDSEIGAATYHAMKAQGRPVAATTRRPARVASDRPLLDLSQPLDSWQPPQATRAACVCIAVARLTACAADPDGTAQINVIQTLRLVEKLVARGIYVLFLSTDQVFDGHAPHMAADSPYSPISEYGRQKARTETPLRELMAAGAPVGILRLAKVISADMPLIHGWIRDMSAEKPIWAFNDLHLAPIPINLVSTTINLLLQDRPSEIFQLTGPRDVSYVDVGRFLASYLGAKTGLVNETSTAAAGLPEGAARPNTTLDSTLLRVRYGIEVPDVWEVVKWVATAAKDPIANSVASEIGA